MKYNKLSKLIPNAIALAMGVASVVLLIMKQPQESIIPMLSIGVLCLGFVGITNLNKESK